MLRWARRLVLHCEMIALLQDGRYFNILKCITMQEGVITNREIDPVAYGRAQEQKLNSWCSQSRYSAARIDNRVNLNWFSASATSVGVFFN